MVSEAFSRASASIAFLIVGILLVAFPQLLHAQISIHSQVTPTSGSTQDSYRLIVTVSGSQSAPRPTLTNDQDFLLSFVGEQTSLSVVNGTVDMNVQYIYQMAARRSGALTAPIAEVDTPQGKLSTPPHSITVSDAGNAPPQGGGQPEEDNNGNPPSFLPKGDQVEDFFLYQSVVPSEKVYVGQQLINTVALYTRIAASKIRLDDLSADGFWQETLSDDQRNTVQIRGVNFSSIQMLLSLYPLRSGTITVPSRRITAEIPFGIWAIKGDPIEAKSDAITIEVLPLPDPSEEVAPHLTSIPLVGETSIKTDYSLNVLKVGESKSVTIQITTEGNSNPIKKIPFKVPAGVKMYEEQADVSYDRSGPRLKTIKRFKYTLVPLRGGYFTVPGVTIAYFDPRSEQYKVVKSDDIAFVVQGSLTQDTERGAADSQSLQQSESMAPTPEQKEGAGVPLPPLYSEPTTLELLREKMTTEILLLILAAAIGVLIILFVAFQVRRPAQGSMVSPEQINASNTIRELQELYHDFLLAKLKVPKQGKGTSGLTVDQIRALLSSSTCGSELIHGAKALLDDFERVQYSASKDDETDTLVRFKERFRLLIQSWGF